MLYQMRADYRKGYEDAKAGKPFDNEYESGDRNGGWDMKCDNCFFCCHIGKGIYADYPVKYCKYHKKYLLPFVETQDNGGTKRQLDFSNIKDLKIWHEVGCNIHPNRVIKAKCDFFNSLEEDDGT